MFFNSSFFWFLMGIVTVLVMIGFRSFAIDRGWALNWCKWLLTICLYFIFCTSFYTLGTLVGENESSAGLRLFLFGLFISLVLGVGLWRILNHKSRIQDPQGPPTDNAFGEDPLEPSATEFAKDSEG